MLRRYLFSIQNSRCNSDVYNYQKPNLFVFLDSFKGPKMFRSLRGTQTVTSIHVLPFSDLTELIVLNEANYALEAASICICLLNREIDGNRT